jgi:hypothetical protein
MSEFPHDTFAKDYLTELLNTIGKAQPNQVVKSERREGDVWFERDPQVSMATQQKRLGLLGQLLRHNALIEVFRNAASEFEVRACKGKLIDIEAGLLRQAHRRRETLKAATLPHLWLLMPTASEPIRRGFGFGKTRIPGVYRSPKLDRTGLVVIHQLAITEETLWLRLLGRSGNQQRAIQELTGKPSSSGLYASIVEILANYRTNLESSGPLSLEEENLIMNLSAAYLKKREEWKLEGRLEGKLEGKLEGRLEGKLETAINLLKKDIGVAIIAEVTGLPIGHIEHLRDQTNRQ